MHRALCDLAPFVSEPVFYEPPTAERFAGMVLAKMEGGLLRYSSRLSLLKQAAAMGIERFEANLIIAAVQSGRPKPIRVRTIRRFGPMSMAVTFAVVQVSILAAAWWFISQ
jgi:hypothetical protein